YSYPGISFDLPSSQLAALYTAVEPQSDTSVDVDVNGTKQLTSGPSEVVRVAPGDLVTFAAPLQSKPITIAPEPTFVGGAAWIVTNPSLIEKLSLFDVHPSTPSAGSVINNISG